MLLHIGLGRGNLGSNCLMIVAVGGVILLLQSSLAEEEEAEWIVIVLIFFFVAVIVNANTVDLDAHHEMMIVHTTNILLA